jgi:hypothetical protein
MSNVFSFWFGQSASSTTRNSYCICGEPVGRARHYAVHAFDGRAIRQCCDDCSMKYAPALAKLAGVERQPVRITDLLADHDAARWELSPVIQECEVVEIDEEWFDDATFDDDAASPNEPTPPTWARAAVVDPDDACSVGACGPIV